MWLRRNQIIGISITAIVLIFLLNWYFYYRSGSSYTIVDSKTKWKLAQPLSDSKFYDEDEMYFMVIGWPTLVEAVEKISKFHRNQADVGWLTHDEHPILSETSAEHALTNLVAKKIGSVQASPFWNKYWEDCWSDKNHLDYKDSPRTSYFRMSADPVCTFLWMLKLRQEPIEEIDKVLAVVTRADEKNLGREDKPQQNGGMRAELKSTNYAYWKPCTLDSGNGESYLPEIVAFHIDRIVQFNRAPAVVPRYISADDFAELSRRGLQHDFDIQRKVDSVLRNCGYNGGEGAEGSFVGWSPFEVQLLANKLRKIVTPRLGELSDAEVAAVGERMKRITPDAPPAEIEWALELVTGHMFGILVGTLSRFRHNQHYFVNPYTKERGPMIYIDNDRSQWDHTPHDIAKGNPLEEYCIFPKKLSQRIMMLRSSKVSLGDILLKISDIYKDTMKEGPLFTNSMKVQLQKNIKWLATAINNCVEKHGEDKVLIPEHWESSTYDDFNFINKNSFFDVLKDLIRSLEN